MAAGIVMSPWHICCAERECLMPGPAVWSSRWCQQPHASVAQPAAIADSTAVIPPAAAAAAGALNRLGCCTWMQPC